MEKYITFYFEVPSPHTLHSPSKNAEIVYVNQISTVPLPKWRQLAHRRLQAHPSPLTPMNTLLASGLPAWLSDLLVPRLMALEVFKNAPHGAPNHCLVNEYLPGQGILPHEDGPAYHPVVATVSLGSSAVLDLYVKGDTEKSQSRVLQERRSLLITTGEMYYGCLHGISELEIDEKLEDVVNWGLVDRKSDFAKAQSARGTRISLTFRDVLKVKTLKGLSFLGM